MALCLVLVALMTLEVVRAAGSFTGDATEASSPLQTTLKQLGLTNCNLDMKSLAAIRENLPRKPTLISGADEDHSWTSTAELANWVKKNKKAMKKAEFIVRWPIGINQFGSLQRRVPLDTFIEKQMSAPESGLLFDSISKEAVEAAGIDIPSVLTDRGLDDIILSVGGKKKGLPFHNHAAAWQTVLSGRKLFLFLPPLPVQQENSSNDWSTPNIGFVC